MLEIKREREMESVRREQRSHNAFHGALHCDKVKEIEYAFKTRR